VIVLLAVLFRLLVGGSRGDGHVCAGTRHFRQRLFSADGLTAVAHVFVMEWAANLRDLVIGLLVAGAVGAGVPESWWRALFFTDHPVASAVWARSSDPVVAILAFVCSLGNVPPAAVLWNGGISSGGVDSLIFADLLILPILNIYRKYYGTRTILVLLGTFYAAMVGAGHVVELLFDATGLIPATVMRKGIS
jgi:uncharacterized membrane protein YraQ (UPF0718 family)